MEIRGTPCSTGNPTIPTRPYIRRLFFFSFLSLSLSLSFVRRMREPEDSTFRAFTFKNRLPGFEREREREKERERCQSTCIERAFARARHRCDGPVCKSDDEYDEYDVARDGWERYDGTGAARNFLDNIGRSGRATGANADAYVSGGATRIRAVGACPSRSSPPPSASRTRLAVHPLSCTCSLSLSLSLSFAPRRAALHPSFLFGHNAYECPSAMGIDHTNRQIDSPRHDFSNVFARKKRWRNMAIFTSRSSEKLVASARDSLTDFADRFERFSSAGSAPSLYSSLLTCPRHFARDKHTTLASKTCTIFIHARWVVDGRRDAEESVCMCVCVRASACIQRRGETRIDTSGNLIFERRPHRLGSSLKSRRAVGII